MPLYPVSSLMMTQEQKNEYQQVFIQIKDNNSCDIFVSYHVCCTSFR
ncbi:hypothetical protein IFVP203_C1130181 [Vibrio parahaemolyticus]